MSSTQWLSVRQAAESLGLGQGAIYQLVASGAIPHHRIGPSRGRILFKPEDLAEYVESCRVVPKATKARAIRTVAYAPKHDLDKPFKPH